MLDQLAAMSQQGMHGVVERVLGLYLESAPKALDELVRALVARDLDATARAAHALKSMSLSIGASRAAAAAKTVEETARGEHALPTDAMVLALTATMDETCGAIAAQLAALAMRPERGAVSA